MSINTDIGRKYDFYKNLIVPRGCYFIVRLDGNCFSRFTERFERPFDVNFYRAMLHGIKKLMTEVTDIYRVHFHSDEISCYFKKESEWFNRRVEKITSITSGILSVAFSKYLDTEAHFDSRILVTPTKEDIEEYEKDRRLNAFRGCVNSYSFYKLADIIGIKPATRFLESITSKDRQDFLFMSFGVNVSKLPYWQRVGEFLEWEEYEREGYNPILKKKVMAIR